MECEVDPQRAIKRWAVLTPYLVTPQRDDGGPVSLSAQRWQGFDSGLSSFRCTAGTETEGDSVFRLEERRRIALRFPGEARAL